MLQQKVIFWGVIISMLLGVLLRFQFAGIHLNLAGFDIYRAHTHAGYYLVFMPFVLWRCAFHKNIIRNLYYVLASLALFIFLIQGYSLLSKILSGLIFLFWLVEIFKSRAIYFENGWQKVAPTGLVFSFFFLILVIVLPRISEAWKAPQIAKGFLAMILLGVIIPFVLGLKYNLKKQFSFLYLLSAILYSLFVIQVAPFAIAIFASLVFTYAFFESVQDHEEKIIWLALSLGLFIYATDWIASSYYIAIAGVHYAFLGPVLLSIIQWSNHQIRQTYLLLILVKCTLIVCLSFVNFYFYFNLSIAILGLLLIFLLIKNALNMGIIFSRKSKVEIKS